MAMKPYVKPRRLKRKPTTRIPKFDDWKSEWEVYRSAPIPMGNPYSSDPVDYIIRREMYKAKHKPSLAKHLMEDKPWMAKTGDVMPHISKRQVTRIAGKGVARLHPIGMAISIADDVKTLYDILK